jgi:hypothetical protein
MDIKKKILNLGFTNRNFGKKVVHVEAPHIFGEKLRKHLMKYKSKCYCLTPANYEYINSFCGINMSKKDFSDYLREYYLSLKKIGINLQMHVHLSMFPEILPYVKKEKMIKESYDFFIKDLGIVPKEIVFGWYASDKESEEIVHKLNLKIRKEHLHIYDWWMK